MGQNIKVDCYSGYRGDERPCRIHFGHQQLDIEKIRCQWITPDARCFTVLANDSRIYELKQVIATDRWEIRSIPESSQRVLD